MLQIIRDILKDKENTTTISLLFANQTIDDIILRKELEACNADPRFNLCVAAVFSACHQFSQRVSSFLSVSAVFSACQQLSHRVSDLSQRACSTATFSAADVLTMAAPACRHAVFPDD
jgi:hypothetical protein